MEANWAEALARELLGDRPRRLDHVAGVARRATDVADHLEVDRVTLVNAAWLHDIGYSKRLVTTEFHALDGARFLRCEGVDPRVVNLVAHHSYAYLEADERGLGQRLRDEFPRDEGLPHDLLCYSDMTTGPDGRRMDVVERLAEIRERYGPENVVTRFITRAEPEIVTTVRRVEQLLADQSR